MSERYVIKSYTPRPQFGPMSTVRDRHPEKHWMLTDTHTSEVLMNESQAHHLHNYAKMLNHIDEVYGIRIDLLEGAAHE